MDPNRQAQKQLISLHQPINFLFINQHTDLFKSHCHRYISKSHKVLSKNHFNDFNNHRILNRQRAPLRMRAGLSSGLTRFIPIIKHTLRKIKPLQNLAFRTLMAVLSGKFYLLLLPIGVFFSSSPLTSSSSSKSPIIFFNRRFSSSSLRIAGSTLVYPGFNPSKPDCWNLSLQRLITVCDKSWRRQVSVIPLSSASRSSAVFPQ